MAKQVKASKAKKGEDGLEFRADEARMMSRSPLTNLFYAAVLGLIYLAVFNQNLGSTLVYAGGAFMFFNTVDYCILYYRLKRNVKEEN